MRRLLVTIVEAPPPFHEAESTNSGDNSGGGGGDTYSNSTMLLILAAMLCALICVLGLNSIMQCSRRRLIALENREATAAVSVLGLEKKKKKKAVRQIPMTVYGAGATTTTDCLICLGEFEDGEKVRVMPECRHGFHVKCIDAWLALQPSCPICRRSLLDKDGPEAGDGCS